MDKQAMIWYILEYYSAMKRNGVPIYPTTWLNLKTSRLTEKKIQSQKAMYCAIPLI